MAPTGRSEILTVFSGFGVSFGFFIAWPPPNPRPNRFLLTPPADFALCLLMVPRSDPLLDFTDLEDRETDTEMELERDCGVLEPEE